MTKPSGQQKVRNVRLPPQQDPAPRQVFGRYFDPIHRRWVTLTTDGPIPEAAPAVKVTC